MFEDDEDKKLGKREKDPIPAILRKLHEGAKSLEQTYNRRTATSQQDKERFRAMLNTVIPGGERILYASSLAQEEGNLAFLKFMLGR